MLQVHEILDLHVASTLINGTYWSFVCLSVSGLFYTLKRLNWSWGVLQHLWKKVVWRLLWLQAKLRVICIVGNAGTRFSKQTPDQALLSCDTFNTLLWQFKTLDQIWNSRTRYQLFTSFSKAFRPQYPQCNLAAEWHHWGHFSRLGHKDRNSNV